MKKLTLNEIKTIAVDVDGTLFDSSGKIMPKTKKALLELQDKGVHLILASGRPVKSMLPIAESLGLHEHKGLILANNGSVGYDTEENKVVFDTPIEKSLAQEILNSFIGREIWPMVESGDHMLVEDVYKGVITHNGQLRNITQREAREGGFLLKEASPVADYIDDHVNKILTIVEPADIQDYIDEYKERFGDRLHVVQTAPYYMEFNRPEANKAYGLIKLGIDPDTLMTFGDSMNDREFLMYSKYPVCMANGQDPVKEVAIYVTSDNDSEGIYEALKHFGLVD
ncbi:MAG: Cof-type HAD-IIB family hydrolase [Erysipelotrichaceae bacterium]|jgi:Cof subfamily protein (haloacid dehalogenase superfamily)